MRLIKKYEKTTLVFQIIAEFDPENFQILDSIVDSLEGLTLIDTNLSANEKLSQRQKNLKHVIMQYDNKPFLDLRLKLSIFEKIVKKYIPGVALIEVLSEMQDGSNISIEAHEKYPESLENIAFSPSVRSKWSDPTKIYEILKK